VAPQVSAVYNEVVPVLGDRVVNISAVGVPFGYRGTVTAIHASTGYVDVLFDSEFVGGRPLPGASSRFRGRLCQWRRLMCIRDQGTAASSEGSQAARGAVAPPPAPRQTSKGRSALAQAAAEGLEARGLPAVPVADDAVIGYIDTGGRGPVVRKTGKPGAYWIGPCAEEHPVTSSNLSLSLLLCFQAQPERLSPRVSTLTTPS